MELSVSGDLGAVLARARARKGARIRVISSRDGIDIVANRSAYLTLARWCMIMAHPEMEDHADPEWYMAAYHLDQVFDTPDASVEVAALTRAGKRLLEAHQVRFYHSERPAELEFD